MNYYTSTGKHVEIRFVGTIGESNASDYVATVDGEQVGTLTRWAGVWEYIGTDGYYSTAATARAALPDDLAPAR